MSASRRPPAWLIVLVALALITAVLWVGARYSFRKTLLAEFPTLPELGRSTPAVRDQLRKADAAARQDPRGGESVGALAKVYHANAFTSQARVAYRVAMKVDSGEPRWPYLLGVLEVKSGQNERATTFLTRALQLDDSNVHAWARLGQIYYRQEKPAQAEQAFRRALARDPNHPHAAVGMARALGLSGKWEEAAPILARAVRAHPVYGPGHRMLALVYAELGRTAEQEYHEDLGSDVGLQMEDPLLHELWMHSSTGSILVTQSQVARTWGNLARSERLLRRALQVAPDELDVRLAMGRSLTTRSAATPQRLAEARHHLEKALEIDSSYVNARDQLAGVLLSLGDTLRAVSEWEQLLREEPDHAMAYMNLGQLRFFQGDYEAACRQYRQGLAIPLDTPYMLGNRGQGYHRLAVSESRAGRPAEALVAFRQAAEVDPLLVENYIDWTRLLRRSERIDEAVAVFQQGVTANPRDFKLHAHFGQFLLKEERFQEALEPLEVARRLEPGSVQVLTALGYVELELGDFNSALSHLRRAIELSPQYHLAHYHLGNGLLAVGDRDGAIEHFETALRLQPGFAPARVALQGEQN